MAITEKQLEFIREQLLEKAEISDVMTFTPVVWYISGTLLHKFSAFLTAGTNNIGFHNSRLGHQTHNAWLPNGAEQYYWFVHKEDAIAQATGPISYVYL